MNDLMQKVKDQLEQAGVKYEFTKLPDDISGEVDVHMRFHGKDMDLAMTNMVFKTEKGLIVVQRRGDTDIDNKKLKKLLGVQRLSLASSEDMQSLGLEPGMVPPLGYDLPFYMDEKVLERDEIYTGTGERLYTVKLNPHDLVKINNPVIGNFTNLNSFGRKRILTGDTPTGKLHLGHYVGTLENRVKLQDEYETFIIEADMHALSTLSETPEKIGQFTREVVMDNLAVGLDPKKTIIFVESEVPEIYELAVIFSMYVSHNRALRNPTIKDEITMKGLGDQFSLGFINYPILQAADILCVKGDLVPVGIDQQAHLEQSRELARDLNRICGKEIFPIPEVLIGRVGKLIGTDGNPKMSKSLGNTIYLSDSAEEVEKKVMSMYTDPTRIKATDPGHIEGNPVFIYLDAFGTEEDQEKINEYKDRYQKGTVGDIEVKKYLVEMLNRFLDPIRVRRAEYEKNPELVEQILREGTARAREEAKKTLEEVKKAMKLDYFSDK